MRLAVIIEGGMVQSIISDDSSMIGKDILIVDYDTDGSDDVAHIGTNACFIRQETITKADISLDDAASKA